MFVSVLKMRSQGNGNQEEDHQEDDQAVAEEEDFEDYG
jgi:hypothetical protein